MENNKPFLSICIPTYNRVNKLKKLVLDILSSPLHNIEVVVLDNCSTDNTLAMLNEIKDERLFVYQNNENIGHILNILKVLQLGRGIYSLSCVDKDWLNAEYLSDFINILQRNMDVAIGYCDLNITDEAESVFFDSGVNSIINLGYLSKHQSGNFYKTEKYKSLEILNRIFLEKDKFDFSMEIINAELAYYYKGVIISIPLITPNYKDKDDYAKDKSYSYKNDFFSPERRTVEYGKYIMHISTLLLSKKDKKKIIAKVFEEGFYWCTIRYKLIMKEEYILQHFQVEQKKISIIDFIYYVYNYYKSFFYLNIQMNYIEKFIFMLEQSLYISFKFIVKIIKKNNKQ